MPYAIATLKLSMLEEKANTIADNTWFIKTISKVLLFKIPKNLHAQLIPFVAQSKGNNNEG